MIIPYEIDPIIDSIPKYKAALKSAFYELESFTCLRFRLRTKEENFLSFVDLGGCWSYVGKVGGKQMVSLGKGCKTKGKATHEILHAIGFVHEHQRPGRDEFIKVKIENIDKRCGIDGVSSCLQNFQTINPDFLNYKGVFDQQSVMHYDGYSFAKSPKVRHPTILNIKTDEPVHSQRLQASNFDLEKICDMYNCSIDKLPSCYSSNLSRTESSRRCNGIADCLDHADELNCHVCGENAIKCFSMNQCILRSHVCDGHKHCVDGSDELYCNQKCSQEYRLDVQNRQYQFQQTEEYIYELSSVSFTLKMTQTDLYWIIEDANKDLVAFSFKQNKIDCPQNNFWYFKTVSSWQKTELISLIQPVFGYIGPADWIDSISPTDDESIILNQPISNMSNRVQSLLVLLERIPLNHNGCKVYVKTEFTIDEKSRIDIMRKLKQTQCLLVTVIASVTHRHKRNLNFDDFELIVDDSQTVSYETSNYFYELEEPEYEHLPINAMDNGYFTTTRISNSICHGMYRNHLSGTYDITSGEFLMHTEEACIESLDCWDSDLSFCFCEISSNQPSCFFEVPGVPNLPVSDIFSRRIDKPKISKKNRRDRKRKHEKISKAASITTIPSTTFSTPLSTTVKTFSSLRQPQAPFKPKDANLNCYKCSSKGCIETIKCSHDQICFTEVRKRGNTIIQLQGGCKESRECYTQVKQSKKWCYPNKDTGSSNWSWCYYCCSKNHCNKKYPN